MLYELSTLYLMIPWFYLKRISQLEFYIRLENADLVHQNLVSFSWQVLVAIVAVFTFGMVVQRYTSSNLCGNCYVFIQKAIFVEIVMFSFAGMNLSAFLLLLTLCALDAAFWRLCQGPLSQTWPLHSQSLWGLLGRLLYWLAHRRSLHYREEQGAFLFDRIQASAR